MRVAGAIHYCLSVIASVVPDEVSTLLCGLKETNSIIFQSEELNSHGDLISEIIIIRL